MKPDEHGRIPMRKMQAIAAFRFSKHLRETWPGCPWIPLDPIETNVIKLYAESVGFRGGCFLRIFLRKGFQALEEILW
jgi:hypothetical protein